jgi:hypothetical protein
MLKSEKGPLVPPGGLRGGGEAQYLAFRLHNTPQKNNQNRIGTPYSPNMGPIIQPKIGTPQNILKTRPNPWGLVTPNSLS